jgi:ubiquinol-cytochrome c reductase cytochrome c subunit
MPASPTDGTPTRRRRRRAPFGITIVLALAATGALWALLAPSSSADSGTDPKAVAQGKELFAQGCASCHGLQGQGVEGRAPALTGVGAAAVDFQVSTGRMPLAEIGVQAGRNTPRYTPAEINQLAAYVESVGGGPTSPTITTADVAAANLSEGGEIFRANCAACHNFAGAGNALEMGRYAPNLGEASTKQIYEAMLTGPESMPVFGDKQITPEQKVAVAKYIESLRHGADPGGANLGHLGPIPEGLLIFIVGVGGLALVTIFIGTKA